MNNQDGNEKDGAGDGDAGDAEGGDKSPSLDPALDNMFTTLKDL